MRRRGVKRRECTIPHGNCRLAADGEYSENWGDFRDCRESDCVIREFGGLDTPLTKWRLPNSLGTVSEIARHAFLIAPIRDYLVHFARPATNDVAAIAAERRRESRKRGGNGEKR
jgi:hypothetical protein